MGQKIQIDKDNTAVVLLSKETGKWVDRTMSIGTMYTADYYGKFTGYTIYFKGADKSFFYKKENVQILNRVGDVDVQKQDVYVEGELVSAFKIEQFERGYYRVFLANGTVFTRTVTFKNNKYKSIFKYYSKLADYAGMIAEKDSPLYFLSQNYKRITTPSINSVLFNYLQGENKSLYYDDLWFFHSILTRVRSVQFILH